MDRLAALNGESRIFTCWICGKVRHVKDAIARRRTTADLICGICVPPGRYDPVLLALRKQVFKVAFNINIKPTSRRPQRAHDNRSN